ncbi:MAG TPA: SsrA-binding protein SmpB [Bacilli bacterium]|nr:SsrA-binding protein SmpB [Bacilli bacterium]
MEIKNKKAYFDYFVIKELEAGVELIGSEVKSIKKGDANLKDCFGKVKDDEIYIINMYVGKYNKANNTKYDERRSRKLLLHKNEILRLKSEVMEEGLTLVPLKLYLKNNKVKLLLGLCKGKKLYDKRQTIKEKDLEMERRREE